MAGILKSLAAINGRIIAQIGSGLPTQHAVCIWSVTQMRRDKSNKHVLITEKQALGFTDNINGLNFVNKFLRERGRPEVGPNHRELEGHIRDMNAELDAEEAARLEAENLAHNPPA